MLSLADGAPLLSASNSRFLVAPTTLKFPKTPLKWVLVSTMSRM